MLPFPLGSLTSTRIKNPLANLTKNQVLRDVEEFADEYNVTDILPELKKGALVARDPTEFETVADLTESELTALRDEVLHKWRQPKSLYFTIILCSIGAAVQYVILLIHLGYTPNINTEDGIRLAPMVLTYHSPMLLVYQTILKRALRPSGTFGSSASSMLLPTLPVLAWDAGSRIHAIGSWAAAAQSSPRLSFASLPPLALRLPRTGYSCLWSVFSWVLEWV